MQTKNQGSGGTNQDSPGGADENQQDKTTTDENFEERKPSYESYKKLLDEKKARDKDVQELKKRLDEIEAAKKKDEEQKLAAKEDFKKLLELREQEKKDLEEKLTSVNSKYEQSIKRQALIESLPGEVPKQYWSLMSLEDIVIDPETGSADEASVIAAAKRFEKEFPEVIRRKNGNGLPGDAAKGGSAKISYSEWVKLPLADKKKYKPADVIDG